MGAVEEYMEMRGGGTLTLRQDGLRVHITAQRPADGRGLYKAWLHGDHGGKLLLGTLAPDGGQLRLERTISVGELERSGCWPQFWAEAPLAFSFAAQSQGKWYCEQHPERLVADPVLKEQISGAMLCRREKEGVSLAAAFRTDAAMPLPSLFCLAKVERWNGRPHLIWSFDRQGYPKVSNRAEHGGAD